MMKLSLEVGAGVQKVSIVTEKTHFPLNRETDNRALKSVKKKKGKRERKRKEKLSCHKTNKHSAQASGSFQKIKEAFLY